MLAGISVGIIKMVLNRSAYLPGIVADLIPCSGSYFAVKGSKKIVDTLHRRPSVSHRVRLGTACQP
ncbi:hypothetical protein D3C78_1951650 [compost metagenome]